MLVADPENYSRPWDAVVTYVRKADGPVQFPEDICVDRLKAGQPALKR